MARPRRHTLHKSYKAQNGEGHQHIRRALLSPFSLCQTLGLPLRKFSNKTNQRGIIEWWQEGIQAFEPTSRLEPTFRPRPRTPWMKIQVPLAEIPKSFAVSLSPVLLQKDLWPFIKVTTLEGKEVISLPGVCWILVQQDLKQHCDPPVKAEAYGGQVINGVLAEFWLPVGPVDPWNPVVIS